MLLMGCSQKDNTSVAEEMADFVDEVYSDVFDAYAEEHEREGIAPDRSAFDRKYLTESLQKIINGEDMIDADYWIQAQDYTTPVFKVVDCHADDENGGYVDIIIKVFGEDDQSATDCRVVVRKENGEWKIDDFQHLQDGQYVGWR